MATSSIFANVVIDEPKMAEAFTDAYIDSIEHPKERNWNKVKPALTDVDDIRRLMGKGDKD